MYLGTRLKNPVLSIEDVVVVAGLDPKGNFSCGCGLDSRSRLWMRLGLKPFNLDLGAAFSRGPKHDSAN